MNTIERLVQFIETRSPRTMCMEILGAAQALLILANVGYGCELPFYILFAPLWMPAAWWASGGLTYTLCYLVFE